MWASKNISRVWNQVLHCGTCIEKWWQYKQLCTGSLLTLNLLELIKQIKQVFAFTERWIPASATYVDNDIAYIFKNWDGYSLYWESQIRQITKMQ